MQLQLDFFATRDDLLLALEPIEIQEQFQYSPLGTFESQDVVRYNTLSQIPCLGIAHTGDYNQEIGYLVVNRDYEIQIDTVRTRKRTKSYFVVSVANNPTGFALYAGGQFNEMTIIQGGVSTTTGNDISISICNTYIDAIQASFTKINRFYVGPEARTILDRGGRLTPSTQCPDFMDLKTQ